MKKLSVLLVLALLAISFTALAAGCGNSYDLTYATWNLGTEADNNIERQMVKIFEEENNVKIQLNDIPSIYEDTINSMAIKGNMPDVFMLTNMNYGLKQKYLTDVTELIKADGVGNNDWDKIPAPIEEAVHYKSGIYAIPFAMHMMGYFVNESLLEDENLSDALPINPTYQQFLDVVKAFAAKTSQGMIGLSHENTILEWYPSSVEEDYGWFTWDGTAYHLDSEAFSVGMAKTKEMYTNGYTYDSLDEETRLQYFEGVSSYVDLWDQGKLALRWGYTYEIPDMKKNTEFDISFVGVPGGRTPIVGDYLGISPTCKNKELAYKFAKWMSFDPAGIRKRIELDKDVTNTLPLTVDTTIISEYFTKFAGVKGIEDLYTTLDKGIVEGVKIVPGYNVSRWTASTGITITLEGKPFSAQIGQLIDQCWRGALTWADYGVQANTLANLKYAAAIKAYENDYR